jgi:hypothetical protein
MPSGSAGRTATCAAGRLGSARCHCRACAQNRAWETKTERSRRTLALPQMAVEALRRLRDSQADERLLAGARWQDTGLVFATQLGTALDAANVRKLFKRVCA